MIDKALMLKWIDALRSGDYPQCRGFLQTTTGLDAMGVLCDIVDPQGWDIEHPHTIDPKGWDIEHPHTSGPHKTVFYSFTFKGVSSTYTLPDPLLHLLGVEENFGYYMVELNDKKALDFEQIAAILERSYLND